MTIKILPFNKFKNSTERLFSLNFYWCCSMVGVLKNTFSEVSYIWTIYKIVLTVTIAKKPLKLYLNLENFSYDIDLS